jgi:hypothetical protein
MALASVIQFLLNTLSSFAQTVTVRWVKLIQEVRFQILMVVSMKKASCLCGIMVSVLATGPNGFGFKPEQGNGFLRAIKICSTPSFGCEVKLEVPCHKILWHVKDPLLYLRH